MKMKILSVKELVKRTHNLKGEYLFLQSKGVFKEHITLFKQGDITAHQLLTLAKRMSIAKWSTPYMKDYFNRNGLRGEEYKCGLCYLGDYFEYGGINTILLCCQLCGLSHFDCGDFKDLKKMISKIKGIKMKPKILEKLMYWQIYPTGKN